MNELKCEERDAQRQECPRPIHRIMPGRREDQAGQEIPILEHHQKHQSLRNADKAQQRSLLVKSAEDAFPNKDQQAKRAGHATNLGERKENEKGCAKNEADPRLRCRPRHPKKNRRGRQKQNEIGEGIEDHTAFGTNQDQDPIAFTP